LLSILKSQQHQRLDVQECRLIIGEQGVQETALDLRVWSRPIEFDGEWFTVFSVLDISSEKRRKLLERIFFHDVLNTASGVKGLSDLLANDGLELERAKLIAGLISESTERLIEEIQCQRDLTAAESGDLEISPRNLKSNAILDRIVRELHSSDVGRGKVLKVYPDSETIEMVSDPVLLRRVMVNLVKNALEATEPGGVVTLGCYESEDGAQFIVHNAGVMASEVQFQIFSRSFSTKGSGRGIGTYSIKLIGEKYLGGRVSFVSSLEAGTRFSVQLPKFIRPVAPGSLK
jgi:signal transduction histidine kinase